MKAIFDLILSSPLIQVSIALNITVIGLFITAALQHRLRKLTAIILSAIMLISISAGVIDGTFKYIEQTNRIQMVQSEKDSLAKLAAGDFRDAYSLAVGSIISQPDRLAAWLTAARAALLAGDMTAADHYYGHLASMTDAELENWDLADDIDEIRQGSNLSKLSGSELKNKANEFSGTVQENIDELLDVLPGIEDEADNFSTLIEIEEQLYNAKQNNDEDVDFDEINEQLEVLLDEPGGEEARDILIDSLVWQENWDSLFDWLLDDGAEGLIDIAELLIEGSLSEGELSDALGTDTDEDAASELADMLWSLRNSAGANRGGLYLALAKLYAQLLEDPDRALEIIKQALNMDLNRISDDPEIIRQLGGLLLMLESMDEQQAQDMLTEWLGGQLADHEDSVQSTTKPYPDETQEPESTPMPDGLSGENIRTDMIPFYNICAPEMIETGRIRFYVTMAEGGGGYLEGEPQASDFEFRTDVGFQNSLEINSMIQEEDIQRYTMLLVDIRPGMTAEQIDLEQAAALEYIRTMGDDENVVVYKGGIPSNMNAAFPAGTTQLFGNMEMETYLFSSDKARLEQFIMADYNGDAFDGQDIYGMISWALNQMTAISEEGVSGEWESFPLTSATPRFGQVIVFTGGDEDHQMGSGIKSDSYIRGAAIAANAAVHIVAISPVYDEAGLAELAEAGRGSYIDPSTDSLAAFYNFVRNREVKVFLADCQIPEDPANNFFELWSLHIPTNAMAGFQRNPGRGVDLIGTLHYSDSSLSSEDFHDYTGGDISDTDIDPFDDSATGSDDQSADQDSGQNDGQEWYDEVTNWPGMDNLRVDGLDRHSIARNDSGIMLVNLLGQGFEGLEEPNVMINFSRLGTVKPVFQNIVDDNTIQFFLPVTMPTGTYSMQVTIGGQVFSFTDTLFIYDADNFTTITLGDWTITASSAEETGSGNWNLSGTVINDTIRFSGNTTLSGNWQVGNLNEISLSPQGEAYISFDPESDDFLVEELFLEEGADLVLGSWDTFTLEPDGSQGVPVYERQVFNSFLSGLSLGLVELPYDTGVLFPDRVEVPIIDINLDLPFQDYLLMYEGFVPCAADAEAKFTADIDSIDLELEAGLESSMPLKFFSVLEVTEFGFEINTAERRIALDLGAELASDKEFNAHLAFKGFMIDEIGLSIKADIPVTNSPIPVTITELGGGIENMAALASGSLSEALGITILATTKLEAGKATDVIPFLSSLSWLPTDKIPPLLATNDTQLKLRPYPFSLVFSTGISLFDAIPMGQAELGIGQYAFNQTLLGIADEEAIGLYADIQVGPTLDFSIVRLEYHAGPRIDINNHGLFYAMSGTAGLGINLGILEFAADMSGTFLVAIHGIENSDWPQISIVANAAPSSGIPGLWSAGQTRDVRLLINEYGICIVGLPSPLDATLEWLDSQINAAAEETWEAVSGAMDALADAGEAAWDIFGDGVDLAGESIDAVADTLTDGDGVVYDTGMEIVDDVTDAFSNAGSQAGDMINQGYSGFQSTVDDAASFLFGSDDDDDGWPLW